ncbi:MAG TPA: TIGR03088 family PEP-CTERM/XrtA system glycosyltransferase [Rhodanobacteraceae bacterium]
MSAKPLIAHVLYRLDTGGMEQVAISIINRTDQRYRHAVVCLAGFTDAMRNRIEAAGVECMSMEKRPGNDWRCFFRLWKTLRRLQPDLVQTYNIGTLDVAPIAKLAGVRRVVHAEHGRDAADTRGNNRKYRRLRRWMQPLVARFIAVSADLERWLHEDVGIAPAKLVCIPNGVEVAPHLIDHDVHRVRPQLGVFAPPGTLLIVNVGRLDAVKDQAGLIDAFRILCDATHEKIAQLRLAIIGEGPERARLEQRIADLGLCNRVRLLGNREDVRALLAECDMFALSSVAEGIPLTVLEAMAAGLPVVATHVGGVGEVVVDGATGALVPASDPQALARALARYVEDAGLRERHGEAGRARVGQRFSLVAMMAAYTALYDTLIDGRQGLGAAEAPIRLLGRGER